jgi:hypothetical protein
MPPPVSGFTLVRNAIRLDFPVVASIRSILPLCDELVVNVGHSDDETLDLIRAIDDPRIRIIESEWVFGQGHQVLAEETQRALDACRHPWGVYIQADEVLADGGVEVLRAQIDRHDDDPRVEGLVVRYRHFYGTPDYLGMARPWYRREVRVVRRPPVVDMRSHADAQGFRVGPERRKVNSKLTDAWMHHYGWARPDPALVEKYKATPAIYGGGPVDLDSIVLPWQPRIQHYQGAHPEVVRDWVDARRADRKTRIGPMQWQWRFLKDYASGAAEYFLGYQPFAFRNYRLI